MCGVRNGGSTGECVRLWGSNTLPPTLPHISSLTSPHLLPHFPYISPYLPYTPTHFLLSPHLPSPSQSVAKLLATKNRLSCMPVLRLGSDATISFVKSVTYLGVQLNSNLLDDDDILWQVKFLYGTGNKLKYRFSKCSFVVKNTLFRSYCTSFYASNLWCNYRSDTFRKLHVAYTDSYRILLHNIPRYVSAQECKVSAHVTTFYAFIRKSLFSFVSQCFHSENKLISALMTSDVFFGSGYFSHYLDMVCR